MNIESLKEALPFLIQANIATLITGAHGTGKSQAVAQYARENNLEFIDLRLGTQDVGDLLGLADFVDQPVTRTIIDENGKQKHITVMEKIATKFMRPEWFPNDPNSKGIIFMDEINRARRDVIQAVFQLVLDKKLHRYTLPAGWSVVAAQNPNSADYVVTDISDKAFMDRFCHIKFAPSKQEFFKYARAKGFDAQIIQFLQDQPELLQGETEAFDLSFVSPSRRSWEAVDRFMKLKPPANIARDVVAGLVGGTAATAMFKALNEGDKPISAKDVLEDYSKFKKRVVAYSDAKSGGRLDMLKFTCDSLLEYAEANKKALEKAEAKNLGDFLWDIPRDLSYSLCRELYLQESTRSVIDEHSELLVEIANRRGLKVKGINSKE